MGRNSMRQTILAGLLLVCAADVHAQSIQVRQNVSVNRDVAKPAFFSATFPDHESATYQGGLGLLADLSPKSTASQLVLNGLFDYQRNNATDALQDTVKAGLSGEYQLRPIDPTNPGHHTENSGLISFRGNFAQNRIKETSGLQEAVYYTHVFVGRHPVPMPNLPYRFGSALEIEYVPTGGIEFDHVMSTSSGAAEGTTTRTFTQV